MGVILTLPDGASPVDPGPSQLDIYAAMVIGHRARDLSDEQALERAKQDVHTAIPYVLEVGRVKTARFQLYLAATVANLTLVAGKSGLSDSVGGGAERPPAGSAVPSDVQAVSHGVVANAARPFSARSDSEYDCRNPSPQPGLFGPVSRAHCGNGRQPRRGDQAPADHGPSADDAGRDAGPGLQPLPPRAPRHQPGRPPPIPYLPDLLRNGHCSAKPPRNGRHHRENRRSVRTLAGISQP